LEGRWSARLVASEILQKHCGVSDPGSYPRLLMEAIKRIGFKDQCGVLMRVISMIGRIRQGAGGPGSE
jgi:hypothetical protein